MWRRKLQCGIVGIVIQSVELTVVGEAGGEQVVTGAGALLGEVDGHPDVLHPALHLRRTAADII